MQDSPLKLSDLVREPSDRRAFLARASALGVTLPAVGAALAGCTTESGTGEQDAARRGASTRDSAGSPSQAGGVIQNADSKLDTIHGAPHGSTSATPPATVGAQRVQYHRYDPTLPPRSNERTLRLHWRAREVPVAIRPDTIVAAWTFEGDIPGPIVHVRQGDTVEFTLTNEGAVPHSMDFHAAQVDPKVAFRSVARGDSVTYTFTPRYAGAFMYHCGTAPVLMHIGAGMYGAIIVDPPTPLPPAKEFVLVQSEFYLAPAQNGIQAFDYNKMMSTLPDFVAFNGRPSQYIDAPIRVTRGDRVRFYVVDAGPTHPCAFHLVGEQFERVYLGAPPENAIRGVQTFNVPAGGGMIFELMADVPGEFPFVNHGFGHGQKGSIGFLVVEE